MKYLITGGCGFIGSNFAEKLLQRGDEVTILDNLSRKGSINNLEYLRKKFPNINFLYADIRNDREKLLSATKNVDVIYHLAGQVAVTTSVTNPREDFEINALGTFNILEAVRLSENKPILIYASTNKVYGGMTDIEIVKENNRYKYKTMPEGIPESRILDFHSPYGCSKGSADQYVHDYSRIYNLKTVVMRQSCIYGSRQFGVEDQGWVAWFTIAAILGKKITIYGDGMQVRDVLYIDDLFNAWDTATKNIDKSSGKIFNVGGGKGYSLSLLELIDLLNKQLSIKIDYQFSDWRPGDQPVYISDISLIESTINWKPSIPPQDGVKLLSDWAKLNINEIQQALK